MNHNVELRTQIGYRFVITIHYQGKYTYVEIYISLLLWSQRWPAFKQLFTFYNHGSFVI